MGTVPMEYCCKLEAHVKKKIIVARTCHEGAQGSKGIAPLYLDLGARLRSVVDVTIRPLYRRGSISVSFQLGAEWASEPVWMCCEMNLHRPGFELRSVQPVAYATMLPSATHPEILKFWNSSLYQIRRYSNNVHSITRFTLCMEHCFAQICYQLLMIGARFLAIMQLLR